jgi:hypothetical protein
MSDSPYPCDPEIDVIWNEESQKIALRLAAMDQIMKKISETNS